MGLEYFLLREEKPDVMGSLLVVEPDAAPAERVRSGYANHFFGSDIEVRLREDGAYDVVYTAQAERRNRSHARLLGDFTRPDDAADRIVATVLYERGMLWLAASPTQVFLAPVTPENAEIYVSERSDHESWVEYAFT